jgi:putative FmdB family regulatory protein
MPLYNYRCFSCEHEFNDLLKIADRKIHEEQPCPECGEEDVRIVMTAAPALAAEVGGSLKKTSDGWRDVLKNMKSKHAHNTIND